MKYDVVIIGSGLGGLLCGNILSREGYSVCLLEKNNKLGGSLQTFGRKGCIFNTGLNYTESLDDGQILNQYFRYFGLIGKLKLRKLDENGFDIINLPSGRYPLAMGHENFRETLLKYFPEENNGLTNYLETIRTICSSISLYNLSDKPFNIMECNSLGIGAADYIKSVIKNPILQNIIAGNNLMYAGHDKKTPLMIHALINNSFIESAWRVVDGSHLMINILAENIIRNGGTIHKNVKAEKFKTENGNVKSVLIDNGEEIEGKYFISNTHPEQLLSMIDGLKISNAFSFRMNNLEDTIGMFTLYLVFRKDSFPYLNYNFYHYNQDNTWIVGEYNQDKWPQMYALMPTATSKSESYAESASVLTYMHYSELKKWENTKTGKRGDEYLQFKKEKSKKLLSVMERQFPGITSCVDAYYSSTPLTWRDYTGTRAGSAFGLLKDFNKPMESVILPRTKIPNLFLTGQNTNVHGILGVTISSVITCSEIIDIRHLIGKIRNA
ncbi:MAG: FAD-dependent oxidoreductase [Bacteroidales bacterium]|jgi:all-trans-retinol 13,14-reductase|nr:FAD-dependent oxidoreductase [Bacteroidales bacterium]